MTARRPLAVLAAALAALAVASPAAARSGLTVTFMEQDFMCTLCHEALDVSQSPEADAERAEIGRLIYQGDNRAQIDRAMVAQFGPAVLAVPKADGFNIVFYVLPPVLLAWALAALAILLPRWRRRTRAAAGEDPAPHSELSAEESRRLEDELARFDA